MRIALIAPDWDNAWIPMLTNEIKSRGHTVLRWEKSTGFDNIQAVNIVIHCWANSKPVGGAKNIMFLRRFELFDNCLSKIHWEDITDLILVNTWIKKIVDRYFKANNIKAKTHLIYNAVDTVQWAFKDRRPNTKIGMACHVHPKKNLPLALEVLSTLPPGYELHIVGAVQDPCTAEYLNHVGTQLERKIYLYDHISRHQLNIWWEQFGFCLSTSLSEGNPNNVLEAMAKGIKPIVLNWPGAEDQFPHECIGNSAYELSCMITNTLTGNALYESKKYRELVQKHFSVYNIKQIIDIALEN
jgi:glycosyltransferase involved in cell wall biosynthesis